MLNRKIYLLFVAMLLAMLCVALPAWANGLSIGPQAPSAVNVGDQFYVNIVVNNAAALMGVQFDLQYDPSKLETIEVTKGSIFENPIEAQKIIDNDTGILKYAVFVLTPAKAFDGNGVAAKIKFNAKAAGQANLAFAPGSTVMGGEGGINFEHTATQTTVTINDITPPVGKPAVSQFQPAAGATGVALDALVKAVFNMNVTAGDLSGVTIKDANGNPVAGVIASLSADNQTLNITHASFAYDTSYSVTIPAGAVKNAQDAVNDQITWSFTTVAKPVLTVTVNLEGNNISPDRPLTINGEAKEGETSVDVDWLVRVKDSAGKIIAEYSPVKGAAFTQNYTPVMDLPVVADYTVQVTATPESGDPVTVNKTFKIYNYPLKFSAPNITGSGANRTVAAALTNLGTSDVNGAKVFCQVTKLTEKGWVVVQSPQLLKDVNVSAGSTKNISFDINVPAEPGTCQVELFVWSNADGYWVTLGQQIEADLVI